MLILSFFVRVRLPTRRPRTDALFPYPTLFLSLGTTFAPNWIDWPMLYHANPVTFAPCMVVFCHMILFNSEAGVAMTLGRTSLVTAEGPEPLSRASLELRSAERRVGKECDSTCRSR